MPTKKPNQLAGVKPTAMLLRHPVQANEQIHSQRVYAAIGCSMDSHLTSVDGWTIVLAQLIRPPADITSDSDGTEPATSHDMPATASSNTHSQQQQQQHWWR